MVPSIDRDTSIERPGTIIFLLELALLALLAVLPYLRTLDAEFTYDDIESIQINEDLDRFFEEPGAFFDQRYYDYSRENRYRPVITLVYAACKALGGNEPPAFHIAGLALHLGTVLSLYGFLALLGAGRPVPFWAAALFAVHPVHVEAVAAVGSHEDLLCAMFYFLAGALFLKARRSWGWSGRAWLAFSCLVYVLSLFSKEMSITFPALVLAGHLLIWRKEPSTVGFTSSFWPLVAISAVYLVLRFSVLDIKGLQSAVHPGGSLLTSLFTMSGVLARYTSLLLVPWPLVAERSVEIYATPFSWEPIMGFIVTAGPLLLAWRYRERAPIAGFAAVMWFISISPVMNIIPLPIIEADRLVYLPSAFFCLLAAIALCRGKKRPGIYRTIAGAAVVAGFGLVTLQATAAWKDVFTLWSHTVEVDPGSQTASFNLANELGRRKDLEGAAGLYRQALACKPNRFFKTNDLLPRIWYNLGRASFLTGDYKGADEAFEEALKSTPENVNALVNHAIVLIELKRSAEAEAALMKALSIDPRHCDVLYNMAVFRHRHGKESEARLYADRYGKVTPPCPSRPDLRSIAAHEDDGEPGR